MAVNMYEGPAEQRFVDTYAPLPFQEVFQVGQQYQRERERTEEEIKQFQADYGDFMSPSAADVTDWEAETMGRLRPQLEQMRLDPEWIKSQGGQAQIRGAIRSIDTAKLNQLRQSAANLQERQKNVAKLQAAGRYKRSWDPIDIASYRTLGPEGQGIMSELSPLEYQSLEELTTPYAESLKPGYIGHVDPYRYYTGITEEDVRRSLEPQFESITSTPQGQAWMRDVAQELAAVGITDPEAVREETLNRMVQSQKDRMVKNLEFDKAALDMAELSFKRAQTGAASAGAPPRLTDQVRVSGATLLQERRNQLLQNPSISQDMDILSAQYEKALASGNREAIKSVEDRTKQYMLERQEQQIQRAFLFGANQQSFFDNSGNPVKMDYSDYTDGAKKMFEGYSIGIGLTGSDAFIEAEAGKDVKKTGEHTYRYNNITDFKTVAQLAEGWDAIPIYAPSSELEKYIENDVFKNVDVSSISKQNVVNQTLPNGQIEQYLAVDVTFTEDDVDLEKLRKLHGRGATKVRSNVQEYKFPPEALEAAARGLQKDPLSRIDAMVERAGGIINVVGGKVSESTTTSERDVAGSKKKLGGESETIRRTGEAKKTYKLTLYQKMPHETQPGRETTTSQVNLLYDKNWMNQKAVGEEYPQEVGDAFSITLNQQTQNTNVLKSWKQRAANRTP